MTTNQTIDGVSRELRALLERIVEEPRDVDAQVSRQAAVDELRALLDAPAVEVRDKCGVQMVDCPECSHQWDHFFECGNGPANPKPTGLSEGWNLTRKHDGYVVGHQSVAYPPDEKANERAERDGYVWVPFLVPAAQPQGVPRELREALQHLIDNHVDADGAGEVIVQREDFDELRALLDAPASVESLVGRTGGGMVWHECTVCHVKGSYHPDVQWCVCGRLFENPAAKPQGEPVAWVDGPNSLDWYEKNIKDLPVGTKLYAEQPAPVAVVMSFDFEHPSSKERRTVALSKQDVFDGLEDYFYDKIGEQICRCESVGETNVVDCSCDEYVHDFEIVKASLTS